jgi:hypothetical protein
VLAVRSPLIVALGFVLLASSELASADDSGPCPGDWSKDIDAAMRAADLCRGIIESKTFTCENGWYPMWRVEPGSCKGPLRDATHPSDAPDQCDVATKDKLRQMLKGCAITDTLYDAASRAAPEGKSLSVVCHSSTTDSSVFIPSEHRISLQWNADTCAMWQPFIQELSNATKRNGVAELDARAEAGTITREDYAQGLEELEFAGVQLRVRAADSCAESIGCPRGTFAPWQRAGSFPEYFKGLEKNRPGHVEGYGKRWDSLHGPQPPPLR